MSDRLDIIEEMCNGLTYNEILRRLKKDIELNMPLPAILDSIFAFMFKTSKELEEIKQCLRTKKDKEKPVGYGDFFPHINKGDLDE